ncbi:hypothetical protein HDU76_003703 [Blyttiomyces sp. JEL0837]|nr:hypothetical protein HDU76_003703 [Blyttiomyces sp. JEL0837]
MTSLSTVIALGERELADKGTGRVRLSLSAFQTHSLSINQCVIVVLVTDSSSNAKAYLCRAWPHLTNTCNHLCLPDLLITSDPTPSELDQAKALPPFHCFVKPIPLRLIHATQVTISIETTSSGDDQFNDLGIDLTSSTDEEKWMVARSMLQGLVIRKGAIVGGVECNRSIRVKILSTEPQTGELQITSKTVFKLYKPTIEEILNPTAAITTSQQKETDANGATGGLVGALESDRPNQEELAYEKPAGLESVFDGLLEIVRIPLEYAGIVHKLGVDCPKGVLLHGPPGVGKTLLVSSVARACNSALISIDGSQIFGSYQGETELRLREKFNEAMRFVEESDGTKSCILFIDEMDALTPNRNNTSTNESRIVATLLTLMDGMKSHSGRLVVVAATNRPNAIDPALRRPGRFDREIAIDAPNEATRRKILEKIVARLPLDKDVDLNVLAEATNGFVGADLVALCREASLAAFRRRERQENLDSAESKIVSQDFITALSVTVPSTVRGTTITIPTGLSWDSVGGLEPVKVKLRQSVEWPLRYRETFERLNLKPPRGILLYGPPGCSKTTLVKIIACVSNANFFSINGAALYSPFVGDSERIIRTTFQRARAGSPSVIFLDEIDTIVGKRAMEGSGGSGSSGNRDPVQERVLSTLLNEMDGIEIARGVLVIGATNRPDMIDAALMRPGRFDRVIYVPPPDETARLEILKIYCKGMPISEHVDLTALARQSVRFTGADLESLCRESAMIALRESRGAGVVEPKHFDEAVHGISPSLSEAMIRQYEQFSEKFGGGSQGS